MDRRTLWAMVHRVTKSQTLLKQLSIPWCGMVNRPETAAAPCQLLPKPRESQSMEVELRNLYCNKLSGWFLIIVKFEAHWCKGKIKSFKANKTELKLELLELWRWRNHHVSKTFKIAFSRKQSCLTQWSSLWTVGGSTYRKTSGLLGEQSGPFPTHQDWDP